MSDDKQTLKNASIEVVNSASGSKTIMKFTKLMKEIGEIEILTGSNNFLWAYGSDITLGYHTGRSPFALNLLGEDDFPLGATFTEPTNQLVPAQISLAIGNETGVPTYYPTSGPEALTEVITPISDTFLEYNSNQTFGDKQRLKVDGKPLRVTLIRFDMTPLVENKATALTNIKLRLYALTSSPHGGKIDILMEDICGEWEENSLSFMSAPTGVFQNITQPVGTLAAVIEYEWAETDLSLDFSNLPLHLTLRITSHFDNGVTYASKENTTAMPELIVDFMGTPQTEFPTYYPTSWMPTSFPTPLPANGTTKAPVATVITPSPSRSPVGDVSVIVSKDAMIRGGEYGNRASGTEPFIAINGSNDDGNTRKSILEFDLSDVPPGVDYSYALQLYVTYTGDDETRSISVSRLTGAFGWSENTVTWNSFGNPPSEVVSWFNILSSDRDSIVSIPLGQLKTVNGKAILVLEVSSDVSSGNKFDFRSRENGSTPPRLVGSV